MKRQSTCQGLTAATALKVFRRSIRLLPALARRGVGPADALAIAYNATFLYYSLPRPRFRLSPERLLKKLSLGQIASACESVLDGGEWGFNLNFKEGACESQRGFGPQPRGVCAPDRREDANS